MLRAACLALTAAAVVCAMPIAGETAADPFNPRIATAMGYRPVPGAKLAHASCIHVLPSGAVAHKHPHTGAWVYRDPTDATGAEVALPKCSKPLIRRARSPRSSRGSRSGSGPATPTQHGPAWIVDAVQENPNAFSFVSMNFTVPPDPTNAGEALLYYWPGTETEAESDVVQPVLQFGSSSDGGGNFWIYASWYVSSDGTVLTSTPTDAIPAGTPLYGSIELSGSNYVSTGVAPGINGSPTVLSVANSEAQLQTRAYVTVEIYNFGSCDMAPPSNALAFTDIVLIDGNGAAVKANFTAETQHQQCNHGIQLGPDSVTITWSS